MDSLDEHAGQVGPLEEIRHGGAVTKGVHRPPAVRSYTYENKQEASISVKCLDKEGDAFIFWMQDTLKAPQIMLLPAEPGATSIAC